MLLRFSMLVCLYVTDWGSSKIHDRIVLDADNDGLVPSERFLIQTVERAGGRLWMVTAGCWDIYLIGYIKIVAWRLYNMNIK